MTTTERTVDQMTDQEWDAAYAKVRAYGVETGKAAGSWVIDGRTSEDTARAILRQIEDCELDVPAPLSGEWADSLTAQDVANAAGVELDTDENIGDDVALSDLCSEFELAYQAAYVAEVERSARAIL